MPEQGGLCASADDGQNAVDRCRSPYGCPRQREELRSFLHQAVQSSLISKAGGRKQTPTRTTVSP